MDILAVLAVFGAGVATGFVGGVLYVIWAQDKEELEKVEELQCWCGRSLTPTPHRESDHDAFESDILDAIEVEAEWAGEPAFEF